MSDKVVCDFCGKEKNKTEMTIFEKYEMCIICKDEQILLNNKHKEAWIIRMKERKNRKNMHDMVQEVFDDIYDPTKKTVFLTKYMQENMREELAKLFEESQRKSRRIQAESWIKAKDIILD